jgi:rhodanese-related sulfurtransferase
MPMSTVRNLVLLGTLLVSATAAQAGGGLRSPAIGPHQLNERLGGANPPLVIDVRSPDQYSSEHIPGAVSIPAPLVKKHLEDIEAAGANAVLYCNDLRFTRVAEQTLMRSGVKGFSHLEGGFTGWTREGLPVEQTLP